MLLATPGLSCTKDKGCGTVSTAKFTFSVTTQRDPWACSGSSVAFKLQLAGGVCVQEWREVCSATPLGSRNFAEVKGSTVGKSSLWKAVGRAPRPPASQVWGLPSTFDCQMLDHLNSKRNISKTESYSPHDFLQGFYLRRTSPSFRMTT